MTDEQRERLKRRNVSRRCPKDPPRGPLWDVLFRLALHETPRNIHKIHRRAKRRQRRRGELTLDAPE
jgi:hypothetical protein